MKKRLVLGVLVGLWGLAAGPACGWAQDEADQQASSDVTTAQSGENETPETESAPAASEVEAGGTEPQEAVQGPSAAPASSPPSVPGLVSFDFKDADIRQVLRIISIKSSVDIVAGADVEGLVTIKLTDVPWEEALEVILRTYGFTYEKKGKIIRVMTVEALEQEALSTEVFPLDYAKAKDVPDIVKEMLSDRGRVKFDERTNTVIVTDIPTTLFQIKQVVERLDQRTPQVLIAAKIVETKLEKDENLGITWSTSYALTQTANAYPSTFPFKAQTTFGTLGNAFISGAQGRVPFPAALRTAATSAVGTVGIGTLSNDTLALTLNALKRRNHTKIVSNPTLSVLDNQEAKVHVGEEFPVPNFSVDPSTGNTTVSGFQSKTIGTVLTVTPHVNPSREIVVDLKPEIISVLSNATFSVGGASTVSLPRFGTQTVTTHVRIKDEETIAIGGLIKNDTVIEEQKVPFLGDLPLIGLLFRNKHTFGGSTNPTLQQDLLIFLTVNLTKEDSSGKSVASVPSDGSKP